MLGPRVSRIGLMAVPLLVACKAYEARPLDSARILADVDRSFRQPPAGERTGGGVSFGQCAEWMLQHGPEVQEAVAAYQTASARAAVDTPWPNPSLSVGPEYGFGSDVMTNRVVPFGSLGITIPTGDRLARQDDVNQWAAEVARVDGLARYRELYLTLRRTYGELAIAQQRTSSREQLFEAANRSVQSAHRVVEAGLGTAIDVALFELEKGRAHAQALRAKVTEGNALTSLALLVGVHESLLSSLPDDALGPLPTELPPLADLKQLLLFHHPELARRRARYEQSEALLRLEISRQYPDFRIGPSIGGEVGERRTTLGLTLGINLPVFDRNQPAIAEAEQRREQSRIRYETAAKRALVELEGAIRAVKISTEQYRLLRDTVLPQADRSIGLARESLAAGSGDALRLLDSERSYRRFLIEVLDAELAARGAWSRLELAVGMPLTVFPHETIGPVQTPRTLENDTPEDPEELK